MKKLKKKPLKLTVVHERTSVKKGDKVVMYTGWYDKKKYEVVLLENLRREFRGCNDYIAFAKCVATKELMMVEVMTTTEGGDGTIQNASGWCDGYTEKKLRNLCKKFNCKYNF
jgi:hypothetical protein